jgi:hypothetical protein
MKSTEPTRTHFVAGDFVSENAVRGGIGRRRRRGNPSTPPTESVRRPITGAQTAPPTAESPVLRRWSVAELIARAVPAPRAERVSRR